MADTVLSDKTDFLNFGTICLRPPPATPDTKNDELTIIITGVGRSGTSMTASVLTALGIFMGDRKSAVFEDEDFLHSLLSFDYARMAKLVAARNLAHPRWGFKFASLQNHILPPQFNEFRNPRLIVVMRDPVAVAARALISDPGVKNAPHAFFNVTEQMHNMATLVAKAYCPTLLVSYEKFISFPSETIAAIAAFCQIELTEESLANAMKTVEPNNTDYLRLFHKDYRGHVDGIQYGQLRGWCAPVNGDATVEVELLVDGNLVRSMTASELRPDLVKAKIGAGAHAFTFDLSRDSFAESCVVTVRAAGTDFVIDGSGRTIKTLKKP
jgi:hypothetical protein